MSRQYIEGTWQKEYAFSPAVVTRGGKVIWLAGVGAETDDEGKSLAGNFEAQVHTAFQRIGKTLERAGGRLQDIVTMTVFILDVRHVERFVRIRRQHFPKGFPASALITVAGFAHSDMMVEIQAIAVVGEE